MITFLRAIQTIENEKQNENKGTPLGKLSKLPDTLIFTIFSFITGSRIEDNFGKSLKTLRLSRAMHSKVKEFFLYETSSFLVLTKAILQPEESYKQVQLKLLERSFAKLNNASIMKIIEKNALALVNNLFANKEFSQDEIIEFRSSIKTIYDIHPFAIHKAFRDKIYSNNGKLSEEDKKIIIDTGLLHFLKDNIKETFSVENNVCILAAFNSYNDVLKFIAINRSDCLLVLNKNKISINMTCVMQGNLDFLEFLSIQKDEKLRKLLFATTPSLDFGALLEMLPVTLDVVCDLISKVDGPAHKQSEIESKEEHSNFSDFSEDDPSEFDAGQFWPASRQEYDDYKSSSANNAEDPESSDDDHESSDTDNEHHDASVHPAVPESYIPTVPEAYSPELKRIMETPCLEWNIAIAAVKLNKKEIVFWIQNNHEDKIRALLNNPKFASKAQMDKYQQLIMHHMFNGCD